MFEFPGKYRIKKKSDFKRVYENGERFFHSYFVIFYLKNGLGYSRLGLTVSRKIGRAVVRNRIKRRLREIFRLNRYRINGGFDLVFNVKRSILNASYVDIERAFFDFLEKCKISHD